MKKLNKGEGEITFFFITLTLSFFIVLMLLIIAVSENNFALERILKITTERTTKKFSVYNVRTDEEMRLIFETIKSDVAEDSNIVFKHFLGKELRNKIIENLKIEPLVALNDPTNGKMLLEKSKIRPGESYSDIINGNRIYMVSIDYSALAVQTGMERFYINLVFIKYRPRSYGYVFFKPTEI